MTDGPVSRRAAWVIGTWFGCGLAPKAPGTVGTLGAIPLYWLVARWGPAGVGATAVGVTLAGVWAASVIVRELGNKDPQVVVVDEVAGMLITMLPMAAWSWRAVAIGVLLFRLLDITKPWPIRAFERLPGGWGVVMDDVAAGVVGACVMAMLRVRGVLP
ncbi:MAG: phosphatidylglycerophosphatase A [Polyangiaceae bacterium]|jgi:phosphatidylglycerophosphatase A